MNPLSKLTWFWGILLVILMVLLTIYSATAYDVEATININESQLPLNGSFTTESIILVPNQTIFFSQQDYNGNITLSFPASIFLNETNNASLLINYSIAKFLPPENITTLSTSLLIRNDYNNINKSYGLIFKIFKDVPPIILINTTNVLELLTGGYNLSFSQDLLPRNGSLEFKFIGQPNSYANITFCPAYLQCPTLINFITNESTLFVNYSIPQGLANQTYDLSFIVLANNINRTARIFVNIITPEIEIKAYVWRDWCFETLENYKVCKAEENEHNKRLLEELLIKQWGSNATNLTVEVEKLVMVGSIDSELKELYDDCKGDYNGLTSKYDTCSGSLNSIIDEKNKFDKRLKDMEQENKDLMNLTIQQANEIKKQARRDITTGIYASIGLFLLILGTLWYIKRYRELNHSGVLK